LAEATTTTDTDIRHMRHALALARRGLGRVAPNPAVGCVIVNNGRIVGRGWTQPGGRPHAETVALEAAGVLARGATAYVTLEPCSHHGETPPCADALVSTGIRRVVCAISDPDERVSGRGLAVLEKAGIKVTMGVCRAEAAALNSGFLTNRTGNRPSVTLKLATSLDGRIATTTGASQWITGPAARRFGHLVRATHDAILVGSGTAHADNPALTCRIKGLEDRSPIRVVLDTHLSIPLTGRLVRSAADLPLVVFCGSNADAARQRALTAAGAMVIESDTEPSGQPAPTAVLSSLAASGVTRLLVEGGGRVAAGFLRAGLVDEVALFRAPLAIGGDGLAAISGFGLENLDEAPVFQHGASRILGHDVLETYRRAH
jgi:diaminohydroxyphosphoribosylaminopyrimidine deaminase/5-amino-6-(5-phosphoribosylamino)uracil reductase